MDLNVAPGTDLSKLAGHFLEIKHSFNGHSNVSFDTANNREALRSIVPIV